MDGWMDGKKRKGGMGMGMGMGGFLEEGLVGVLNMIDM